MRRDADYWLGYLGQTLVRVLRTSSHKEATDTAAHGLRTAVERGRGAISDSLREEWQEEIEEVQDPGPKGEEDDAEAA